MIRVESLDDGGCEVATFGGPRALERALAFGSAFYSKVDYRQKAQSD